MSENPPKRNQEANKFIRMNEPEPETVFVSPPAGVEALQGTEWTERELRKMKKWVEVYMNTYKPCFLQYDLYPPRLMSKGAVEKAFAVAKSAYDHEKIIVQELFPNATDAERHMIGSDLTHASESIHRFLNGQGLAEVNVEVLRRRPPSDVSAFLQKFCEHVVALKKK